MTDSASGLTPADAEKYGLTVLPFQVTLGDQTYLAGVDLTNDQFYALMDKIDGIPTTAQITPFEFTEIYLKEAKAGTTDLVLVLINSQGSATYANSVKAVEMFYADHPEYKDKFHVHNFDGVGYNAFYGAPVVEAAKMVQNGTPLSQILDYLTDLLPRRQVYFGMYDLKYAAKSGRIPTAVAFVGSVLNIKPIMKIADNAIVTGGKCIGERKLLKTVVNLSVQAMAKGSPYQLIYGSNPDNLAELKAAMLAATGYAATGAYQVDAAVAANAGPRVVGVAFTKKSN